MILTDHTIIDVLESDYARSSCLQAIFTATETSKVSDLKHMMAFVLNREVHKMYLFYKSCPMSDGSTLVDYNVRNGGIISMHYLEKSGRPGIYFLGGGPPVKYNIGIDFDHERYQEQQVKTYPKPDLDYTYSQERMMVTVWRVEYEQEDSANGLNILKHMGSNSKCSAIFWEPAPYCDIDAIQSGKDMEISQHNTPSASTPSLCQDDTVVLSIAEFIPYLDDTLSHLGLPPKIAMQCIGYWLPRFFRIRDRGLHIGFRFVKSWNKYVPEVIVFQNGLGEEISPPHIFLVFGGVPPRANYDGTKAMAEAQNTDWIERLGLDVRKMQDKGSLRLIAWDGMEVPPAELKALYGWEL